MYGSEWIAGRSVDIIFLAGGVDTCAGRWEEGHFVGLIWW